jgi:hypothetical protein
MARTKVPDADLRSYLASGHTQADAARHFGVTESAIHQRLKKRRELTSRVVALEQAGAVVGEQLSASARLERVQTVIDGELAWAVAQAHRDGADRASLADVILKLAGEVPTARAATGYHPGAGRYARGAGISTDGHRCGSRREPRDGPPDCGPPEGPPGAAAERGPVGAGRGRVSWRSGVTRSTS